MKTMDTETNTKGHYQRLCERVGRHIGVPFTVERMADGGLRAGAKSHYRSFPNETVEEICKRYLEAEYVKEKWGKDSLWSESLEELERKISYCERAASIIESEPTSGRKFLREFRRICDYLSKIVEGDER